MITKVHTSWDTFEIDLNDVRDGNLVVTVPGLERPQAIPPVGAGVAVRDEDGYVYEAVVDEVLPDGRMYLRASWATQRLSHTCGVGMVFLRHAWTMPGTTAPAVNASKAMDQPQKVLTPQ
jgi:hypothetical protein